MGLAGRRERAGGIGATPEFCSFAITLFGLSVIAAPMPAVAAELSAPQAALYSTVSIYPPSAQRMTVCYGFVYRRREILDFTLGDRSALTNILATRHSSPTTEH